MPRNNFLLSSALLAISAVALSCASVIRYSVQYPPEIDLGDGPDYPMVIINRFDTTQVEFAQDKKVSVFNVVSTHLFDRIVDELGTVPNFHAQRHEGYVEGGAYYNVVPPLTPRGVQSICSTYQSAYLVSLETCNAYFDQEVVVNEDADGFKDREAFYDLVLAANITIYDSLGKVVFTNKFVAAAPYESRSVISGLLAVGPSLANTGEELTTLSEQLAADFLAQFFVYEDVAIQYYYNNKAFSEATDMLSRKDWDNAILAFLPLDKYKRTRTKGKACFNIAVCYLAQGEEDLAWHWYEEATKYMRGQPDLPFGEVSLTTFYQQ